MDNPKYLIQAVAIKENLLFDFGPVVACLSFEDLLKLLDGFFFWTERSLLELANVADTTPFCKQQDHILACLVDDLKGVGGKKVGN